MARRSETTTERFGDAVMVLVLRRPQYVKGSGNINWAAVCRDLPGIHPETLRLALIGQRWPSTTLIEAVAQLLDVDPRHFGEFRLAKAREALDPDAQGGGDEGFRRALANLDQMTPTHDRETTPT